MLDDTEPRDDDGEPTPGERALIKAASAISNMLAVLCRDDAQLMLCMVGAVAEIILTEIKDVPQRRLYADNFTTILMGRLGYLEDDDDAKTPARTRPLRKQPDGRRRR